MQIKKSIRILLVSLLLLSVILLGAVRSHSVRAGVFAGNNGKIAFTTNRDGNYEIYTMNPDGTGLMRLTNNSADDRNPNWSPDGTKIAFSSTRDGNYEIYTMNPDGTGLMRLTNTTNNSLQQVNREPNWSPSGAKIAFERGSSTNDGANDIYVMNPDGTGQTPLTTTGYNDNPSWSPDGNKIVFHTCQNGGCSKIYVMNSNGSGTTQLTPGYNNFPSWSPSGAKIVFSKSVGPYSEDLFVVNSNGSGTTQLTNATNSAQQVKSYSSWSPEGTKIVYTAGSWNSTQDWDIYVININGTGQTRLTNNNVEDSQPSWQPLIAVHANNDIGTAAFNHAVTMNVLVNDTVTYGLVFNPGSVSVTTAPLHGTTSVNTTTGFITYTPSYGWIGTDSFIYKVCSGANVFICATATVKVTTKGEYHRGLWIGGLTGGGLLLGGIWLRTRRRSSKGKSKNGKYAEAQQSIREGASGGSGDNTPGIFDRWGNMFWVAILIGLILVVGTVGGVWKILSTRKKAAPTATVTQPTVQKAPEKAPAPADNKANIEAAMQSGNTAALEGYMAPTVTVLIWSSEGPGPQTPTQAVSDLSYLSSATTPWDFNQTAAYRAGRLSYWTAHFTNPATAMIGKSADNQLIMINFDNSGKISVIIMAKDANII